MTDEEFYKAYPYHVTVKILNSDKDRDRRFYEWWKTTSFSDVVILKKFNQWEFTEYLLGFDREDNPEILVLKLIV